MIILGLDPGSMATGYGVVDSRPGRLTVLAHGTIRPPRNLPFLDRLPFIAVALERIVDSAHPETAAAEDLFCARDSRTAIKLGHVRAAALLPVLRAGVPVHAYSPRRVKLAVAGYGGAEKEQVRRMVRILLGLKDERLSYDASDALAVAICHAHTAPSHSIRAAAGL